MPVFKDIYSLTSGNRIRPKPFGTTDVNSFKNIRIQAGYDQYATLEDIGALGYLVDQDNGLSGISSYQQHYFDLNKAGTNSDLDIEKDALQFNHIYGISGTLPEGKTNLELSIEASAISGMKKTYADKKMPILIYIGIGSQTINLSNFIQFSASKISNENSRISFYKQFNGVINPGIVSSGFLVISITQLQVFSYTLDPPVEGRIGNLQFFISYSWYQFDHSQDNKS